MWPKRQGDDSKYAVEQLGSLESELMQRIWARGEISVRDLHFEVATRLAYTTIMTTLDRLYKKGLLNRRKIGRAYYYAPKFTQEEYQGRLTQHFMGMVFHEGKPSNAVLSCFVDVVTEADRQMLDKLEQLVKAKRRALRRGE